MIKTDNLKKVLQQQDFSQLNITLSSIQKKISIENKREEIFNRFLRNISLITTISISLFLLIIFIEYALQIIRNVN
tara:strand:- start:3708 stop:3935 length:228 start_codon:yes stop_codon:yes gene_type:complete